MDQSQPNLDLRAFVGSGLKPRGLGAGCSFVVIDAELGPRFGKHALITRAPANFRVASARAPVRRP